MMRYFVLFLVLHAILSFGCNPRATVRQNPGPRDTGLRFYRPKPYLLITPAAAYLDTGKTEKGAAVKEIHSESDRFVQIKLEYLPDFAEEYSISVRAGLGTNTTKIALKDGWNLTQLDQDLDSNFDDNVKAFAELAKAGSAYVGTRSAEADSDSKAFVVSATNIPLGYYESVISRDSCGRKQMYGWRYVGFAPFNGCPSSGRGNECMDCQVDLYGLVFRNGVMTFAPLAESQLADTRLTEQKIQTSVSTSDRESATMLDSLTLSQKISLFLKEATKASPNVIDATVTMEDDKTVVVELNRLLLEGESMFIEALVKDCITKNGGDALKYSVISRSTLAR
jgi:hypothetical protein